MGTYNKIKILKSDIWNNMTKFIGKIPSMIFCIV